MKLIRKIEEKLIEKHCKGCLHNCRIYTLSFCYRPNPTVYMAAPKKLLCFSKVNMQKRKDGTRLWR